MNKQFGAQSVNLFFNPFLLSRLRFFLVRSALSSLNVLVSQSSNVLKKPDCLGHAACQRQLIYRFSSVFQALGFWPLALPRTFFIRNCTPIINCSKATLNTIFRQAVQKSQFILEFAARNNRLLLKIAAESNAVKKGRIRR